MYFDNFVNLYIFSIFYNTKFRRGFRKSIDLFKINMFLLSIVEKTYLPIEMELLLLLVKGLQVKHETCYVPCQQITLHSA